MTDSRDWRDDPAIAQALATAAHRFGILAQPDAVAAAELAVNSLHPVSVVHGDLDSAEAVDVICTRLPELAHWLGSTTRSGGNDHSTWLFPSARAAAAFVCEAAGLMEPWWTVTETPSPVYDKLAGLAVTLMPGLDDGHIFEVIGPGTDWERAVNAWCGSRAFVDGSRDPGQYQQRALRKLGPALAAAALGHVVEFDPGRPPDTRQWTCRRCHAPVCVVHGVAAGAAVTSPCQGVESRPNPPGPLTADEAAAFRARARAWLLGHPKATSVQVRAALGCSDLELDELHGMAADRILAIRNVDGCIGWEVIR